MAPPPDDPQPGSNQAGPQDVNQPGAGSGQDSASQQSGEGQPQPGAPQPGAGEPGPRQFTDEEIWGILLSEDGMRVAQQAAQYLEAQGGQGGQGGAPRLRGDDADLVRRAEERDPDALWELYQKQRETDARSQLRGEVQGEVRRGVMTDMLKAPILAGLTQAEYGAILSVGMQHGEQAMLHKAMEVGAEKLRGQQGGNGQQDPPQPTAGQEAQRAAANQQVAAAQGGNTPNLPGAQDTTGAPVIDLQSGKSAVDVLEEYFASQEGQKS